MRIREDTESLFQQDKSYVLDYLKSRGVVNRELKKTIQEYPFGLIDEAEFDINGEKYSITHFLGCSQTMGYDIRKVNEALGTADIEIVVFALVLGDDALCYDLRTKEVFLWLIQTNGGERIFVSNNLTKFLKSVTKQQGGTSK
jgi:hypothetical protein